METIVAFELLVVLGTRGGPQERHGLFRDGKLFIKSSASSGSTSVSLSESAGAERC